MSLVNNHGVHCPGLFVRQSHEAECDQGSNPTIHANLPDTSIDIGLDAEEIDALYAAVRQELSNVACKIAERVR